MRQKSPVADVSEHNSETSTTVDIWDILAKMVHIYAMSPDQLLDLPCEYFLQLLNKMPMVESSKALCLVTHLMRAIFGDIDADVDAAGSADNPSSNVAAIARKNKGNTTQAQNKTIYVNTPEELRSALAALGGM